METTVIIVQIITFIAYLISMWRFAVQENDRAGIWALIFLTFVLAGIDL